MRIQVTIHAGRFIGTLSAYSNWCYYLCGEAVDSVVEMNNDNEAGCIQVRALLALPCVARCLSGLAHWRVCMWFPPEPVVFSCLFLTASAQDAECNAPVRSRVSR